MIKSSLFPTNFVETDMAIFTRSTFSNILSHLSISCHICTISSHFLTFPRHFRIQMDIVSPDGRLGHSHNSSGNKRIKKFESRSIISVFSYLQQGIPCCLALQSPMVACFLDTLKMRKV